MFTAMVNNLTPISRDHNKKLVKIIQTLLAYEESNYFRKPIPHKALGWNSYRDVVQKNIDLNLIRRQYNEGKYKSVEQFLDDIQLVWHNVFSYGKRDHDSYDDAIKMQKYFDDLLNDYYPEYFQKLDRVNYFKQFQSVNPPKNKNDKKPVNNKVYNSQGDPQNKGFQPILIQRTSRGQSRPQTKSEQKSQFKPSNLAKSQQTQRKLQVKQQMREKPVDQYEKQQKMDLENEEQQEEKQIQPVIVKRREPTRRQQSVINNSIAKNDLNKQLIEQPKKVVLQKLQSFESIEQQNPNIRSQQRLPSNRISDLIAQIPQPIQPHQSQQDNQSQQQNHLPPILVNLNQSPTLEQIQQITQVMQRLFQSKDFQSLSKVVRILTKYEKENMIIDGEDVNFRINSIHISTYVRIKKELQGKINSMEVISSELKQIYKNNNIENQMDLYKYK